MFYNRLADFFRDHSYLITEHKERNRQYTQSYRMVWAALGLICGIVLIHWNSWLLLPVIALLLFGICIAQYQQQKLTLLLTVICLLFGASVMLSHQQELENARELLNGQEQQYVTVTGTVLESKKEQSYCWIQLESGERVCMQLPYTNQNNIGESKIAWYPAGTSIIAEGQLCLPDTRRNPGGFDEAAWMQSKKTALVLQAKNITVQDLPSGLWYVVLQLYNRIESMLYCHLPEQEANLAMALLTGAKHQLEDSFYRMTQYMGIAHIFAVSGLHVGVIGTVILFVFRQCGWERSWISFFLLTAGLLVYCMLVGLPASALRAAGMIVLAALAMRFYRPGNSVNFLALAALVLLMENPYLLWTAGFQLSFGVTLALLLFAAPIQAKLQWITRPWLRSSLAVVLAAWLGSVPLSAWHFYTITPLSPLFNFVLVPLVSALVPVLLVVLLFTAVLPAGAPLFFLPAHVLLWILQNATMFFYELFGRIQWNIGQPAWYVMLLYGILLILLWYWLKGAFHRKPANCYIGYGIVALSIIIILCVVPTPPEKTRLLYLDTGQGSCAMLHTTAGEVVLFDTGAQTRELASVLAWYGINQVDAVILSHTDTDHINGLQQVLETVRVKQLISCPEQLQRETMTEEIQLAEQKHAICEAVTGTADLVLRNGCVHLQYIQDDTGTANGSELTAVLQYGQVYAAFPGDLAAQGVLKLVKAQDTITIWAVPHHGSRFSGTAEIYRLLRQKGVQYAVISAGQNNRYGHPHQEVLKWMEVNHISYRQTAEQGAVLFIL